MSEGTISTIADLENLISHLKPKKKQKGVIVHAIVDNKWKRIKIKTVKDLDKLLNSNSRGK